MANNVGTLESEKAEAIELASATTTPNEHDLAEIFAGYGGVLARNARTLLRSEADAEDAFSNSLTRMTSSNE